MGEKDVVFPTPTLSSLLVSSFATVNVAALWLLNYPFRKTVSKSNDNGVVLRKT